MYVIRLVSHVFVIRPTLRAGSVCVYVHGYLQMHVTVYLSALCSVCDPGIVVVAQWILFYVIICY